MGREAKQGYIARDDVSGKRVMNSIAQLMMGRPELPEGEIGGWGGGGC